MSKRPILWLLFACSCSLVPSGEPDIETDNLAIYNLLDVPVCAGSVHDWEALLETTSATHGLAHPGKIHMVVTEDVRDDCPGSAGCFYDDRSTAFTRVNWAHHELAHSVQNLLTKHTTAPVYREGFTQYLVKYSVFAPVDVLSAIEAEDASELNYRVAANINRWLFSNYPEANLRELYRASKSRDSPEKTYQRIETYLGIPRSELQSRYWNESSLFAPAVYGCSDVDEVVSASKDIEFDYALDCDSETTLGPYRYHRRSEPYRLATRRTIEVEEDGQYLTKVSAGGHILIPCDPIDDEYEALPWLSLVKKLYDIEESHTQEKLQDLRAGRYLLWIVGDDYEPVDGTFRAHAAYRLSRVALND